MIAVCARLIQGFALGGEVGSASIYMMESSSSAKRGYAMSWQGASQGIAATIGALVGLGLSLIMSETELAVYGWRIALLLGASIVPFALLIRNSLPETIGGAHGNLAGQATAAPVPLTSYMRPVVCGFLIIASGTIATYIFNYMATYGQNTLGLSTSVSLAGEFVNNGIGVVTVMIGGAMSDLRGRRPIMLWGQLLFGVLILPCFIWLTTARSAGAFIGVNLILSAVGSFAYGAVYAGISESLPRAVRARVFALVYSVPVALFGGTTQVVVTWLLHVTGNPMSIAWYLTAVTFLGLLAMLAMRESAPARTVRV